MITTIICDWGGVLSHGKWTQAILDVLSKEKPISIEKIYKEFNEMMIQMNQGILSSGDFVKKANQKFHLRITEEEMRDVFKRAIVPNKEMITLLKIKTLTFCYFPGDTIYITIILYLNF